MIEPGQRVTNIKNSYYRTRHDGLVGVGQSGELDHLIRSVLHALGTGLDLEPVHGVVIEVVGRVIVGALMSSV